MLLHRLRECQSTGGKWMNYATGQWWHHLRCPPSSENRLHVGEREQLEQHFVRWSRPSHVVIAARREEAVMRNGHQESHR